MADPALIDQAMQALEALKAEGGVDPGVIEQCLQAVQSQADAGQQQTSPEMPEDLAGLSPQEANASVDQAGMTETPAQGETPPPRDAFAGARQAVMQHMKNNGGELPDSAKGREEKKKKKAKAE